MGLLSWLYGTDQLQAEGDKLDAELAAANLRDYGPGSARYNAGQWAQIEQNMASGATGNVDAQINEAFMTGLEEGRQNITGAVSGTFGVLGGGLGAVLKGIPWYVWLGVGLFFAWPFIARRLT